MANPTEKSDGMADFLEQLSGRTTAITNGRCVNPPFGCGKSVGGFRDPLSFKEFTISGMCQHCQDNIFGTGE